MKQLDINNENIKNAVNKIINEITKNNELYKKNDVWEEHDWGKSKGPNKYHKVRLEFPVINGKLMIEDFSLNYEKRQKWDNENIDYIGCTYNYTIHHESFEKNPKELLLSFINEAIDDYNKQFEVS